MSYQAGALAAVGLATMAACSQNKKQTVGFATGGTALALALYEMFLKQPIKVVGDTIGTIAKLAAQLTTAVKNALNSLLPGLGKLLEPFQSFFDWLEKSAGSVAQVIVMVVGGYIVLKVIRR